MLCKHNYIKVNVGVIFLFHLSLIESKNSVKNFPLTFDFSLVLYLKVTYQTCNQLHKKLNQRLGEVEPSSLYGKQQTKYIKNLGENLIPN